MNSEFDWNKVIIKVLIYGGATLIVFGISITALGIQSRGYLPVSGTVISNYPEEKMISGKGGAHYNLNVSYRYERNSSQQSGSGFVYPWYHYGVQENRLENFRSKYAPGSEVTIYVDPSKDDRAKLYRGVQLAAVGYLVAGVIWLIFGIFWKKSLANQRLVRTSPARESH
jgi:hypothetical protein